MTKARYTREMLKFLQQGYKELRVPELTAAFNLKFGLDKTTQQIKCCLSNHKFTCGRPTGGEKGKLRLFTQEQMDFIQRHYQGLGRSGVHRALNAEFGSEYTQSQVVAFIKNHKLYSARTGHFQKGQKPWNHGLKGWDAGGRSSETQFKKGRPPEEARNYQPIGSVRVSKDGYLERKVTDDHPTPARRWVGEHRLVWEAEHGPIPEGNVVVFLDGDPLNATIGNLRCVPRGVLARMNKRGHSDTTGEARKAAILTSELDQVAYERTETTA